MTEIEVVAIVQVGVSMWGLLMVGRSPDSPWPAFAPGTVTDLRKLPAAVGQVGAAMAVMLAEKRQAEAARWN